MPSLVLIDQAGLPAATANKSRSDLVIGNLVTCSQQVPASSYLWTLIDTPIRSALVRGTVGTSATFTFTPDSKGTYEIELEIDGGGPASNTVRRFGAVLTSGGKTLGWRYLGAAEEEDQDNQQYPGLGFPADTNIRGWATPRDTQLEEAEESVWETQNSAVTSPGLGDSRMVRIDPATGRLDPTVVAVNPGDSPPVEYTGGSHETETVLGLERVIGGVRVHGGDIDPARTYRFRMLGSFSGAVGTDYAKLRLYDMGPVGGGPQAGVLRAEVSVAGGTGNQPKVVDQVLTPLASPVISGDIYNTPRKYEVRLFLDSATPGTFMNVSWGGIVAE